MKSPITYTGAVMVDREILPAREKSGAAVQSVDRALVVLEILGRLGAAGVTEIAAELGVHKSTVSRLIAVLESRGFVEQLADRRYRLGFTIVRLAGATTAQMDLSRVSQETCSTLAARTGETTNVAILDGARIINVVEAYGQAEIGLRSWVGQSCPAYATSSGKVLLAGRTAEQLDELIAAHPQGFTDNTITDRSELTSELDQVRREGWASCTEELETGLNAVAAPVRNQAGDVVAALSVSGPTYRLDPSRFGSVAQATMEAAGDISRRLGHYG